MKRRYHLPARVTIRQELPPDDRRKLEQAILSAVRSAVESAAMPGAEIVLDGGDGLRERFQPDQYDAERGVYRVPSYDDGGEPVDVQVKASPPQPWTNERIAEHIRATFGQYGPRGKVHYGVQTRQGTFIIVDSAGGRPSLARFAFSKLKKDTEGHWLPTEEESVLPTGRYQFQVKRKSTTANAPHPYEAVVIDQRGDVLTDPVWTRHEIGYTVVFDVPEPAVLSGEGRGGGGLNPAGQGGILPGGGGLIGYQCHPVYSTHQLTDPFYAGMSDDDLWRLFINLCKARAIENLDLSERYIRDQLIPRFSGPGGSVTTLSTYSRHNVQHFQERLRLLRGLMFAHADLSQKIEVRADELFSLISIRHSSQQQYLSPFGFGSRFKFQAYWPTIGEPAPQHAERVRVLRKELDDLTPQFAAVVKAIATLLEEDPFLTNFVSGLRVDRYIDVSSPEKIGSELADVENPLQVQESVFRSMDKILASLARARKFLCVNHERVLDVPIVYESVLAELEGIDPHFTKVARERIAAYQKHESWIEIGLSALGLVLFVGGLIVSLAGGPAGVAAFLSVSGTIIGGVQAMRSVDKAAFTTSLSEATVISGQGLISLEAASEARFWAKLDVILSAVDVVGHGLKAVTAVRSARALATTRSLTAAEKLAKTTASFEESVEAANRLNFESLWQRAGPGRQLQVSASDLQRLAASAGNTSLSGQVAEELVEQVAVNTREFLPLATKLQSNQGIDLLFVRRNLFETVFGAVGQPGDAARILGQATEDQVRQLGRLINAGKAGDLVAVEVKFTTTGQSVEELLTLGSRAGNQFNLTWFTHPQRGILQAMGKISDPNVRATGKLLEEVIGSGGQFMERLARVGITVAPDGRYGLTTLTEQILSDAAASKALYSSMRYQRGYLYGLLRAERTGNAAQAARYRAFYAQMNAQIDALDAAVRRAKQAQEMAQRLTNSLQRSQDAMVDVAQLSTKPQTPGILQAMQAASATARAHLEFIKHRLPEAETDFSAAQAALTTAKLQLSQQVIGIESLLDELEQTNPGLRESLRQAVLSGGAP